MEIPQKGPTADHLCSSDSFSTPAGRIILINTVWFELLFPKIVVCLSNSACAINITAPCWGASKAWYGWQHFLSFDSKYYWKQAKRYLLGRSCCFSNVFWQTILILPCVLQDQMGNSDHWTFICRACFQWFATVPPNFTSSLSLSTNSRSSALFTNL